jgi:hypothetical protein
MPTDSGSADHITLIVPAQDVYAKTARMTAAALVSRLDIGYDDLDDVRTATEEAFIYACDAGPESGEVTIHFYLESSELRIEVPIAIGSRAFDEEAERRSALANFILEGVCDTYEMSSDDSGAWLRLSKRFSPVSVDAD